MSGLVLITPSSVVVSGTGSESATINDNGSVTIAYATGLELRGIFSSSYVNYHVSFNGDSFGVPRFQMMSGASKATGSNYVRQNLGANGSTIGLSRATNTEGSLAVTHTEPGGFEANIFAPYLAQYTVTNGKSAFPFNDGYFEYESTVHQLATSYDGLYLFPSGATQASGRICVFGWAE